ncbi:MAG: aminotransferase class I/II-fold pyridoxal phosphate-dependent enzyme [Bacteroidota bacterium]
MDLSYILNQLGEERADYYNAVAPPIIQTSNFAFDSVESLRDALSDESKVFLYSRGKNPTIDILQQKLAALDGAEAALVFASGVAAVTIPIVANVKSGDHIVCVAKPYSWTNKLFTNLLPRFGVTCTMIDGKATANFEKAIQPNTRLIFLESPNTFTYELQDLKAIANLAKSKNILTMIDNSYCTPLSQKPIEMGIDLSMQTMTKYIGGHSDAVGGVISGSKEILNKIFVADYLNIGASVSPFNAFLFLRGLRTIELRVERSCASAATLVGHFENHPKVLKMYYPFSKSFPQRELAMKQMKLGGGMFTMALDVQQAAQIETFCNSLNRFLMAVSWGGHESLAFPVCATIPKENFDHSNIEHKLVRFYIGLEDPGVLVEDIEKALKNLTG